MPTPEEIKNIAREYGESEANCFGYDMYSNPDFRHKLKAKSEANKAKAVLQWLSKDYCIVPKKLIRKEYEKAQKTHDIYTSATCINEMESRAIDHAEGRMCELKTLFGKSLFEEE